MISKAILSNSAKCNVRLATRKDLWNVAEVHTSSFFPDETFLAEKARVLDRYLMLEAAIRDRNGRYVCLVAERDVRDDARGSSRRLMGCVNLDTLGGNLPMPRSSANAVAQRKRMRRRREKVAYLSNLAVDESFRRQGIGLTLVERAEEMAWEWGCESVALHCDIMNGAATELYRGLGYRLVGVEPAWNSLLQLRPNVRLSLLLKRLPKRKT